MKTLERAKIAIIVGTGFEHLLKNARQLHMRNPYGTHSPIHVGKFHGENVVFLLRHGLNHSVPPHKVNYKANIHALNEIGVTRILATNAVGAINLDFKPGNIIIPHDFVDFTKLRPTTFYDKAPVTHVDVSQPFCPEIRRVLIETTEKLGFNVLDKAILVCTEGPRYETPAEIKIFRHLGCDIVGMTSIPETVLSRELEICYASICYVSNMAAGIERQLTLLENSTVSRKVLPMIEQILIDTIKMLPSERNCPCARALEKARID